METKVAVVFVLFLAVASAMIADQENRNPNNYYQNEVRPQYTYQASLDATYRNGGVDHKQQEELYTNVKPNYEFQYAVNDENSGDIKSHYEIRDGDNVKGVYTLLDADGYKRIVEYTADKENGFNAIVRREPLQNRDQQYVKSYKNPVIYEPNSLIEKHTQNQRYLNHKSESNINVYNMPYATKQPQIKYESNNHFEPAPEIKYFNSAPEYKYVTEAPEFKYSMSAPLNQHVAEAPDHKYDTESSHYNYEEPQYQYATNHPQQYQYVTDEQQYKYVTEAPLYQEYSTELSQYNHVMQTPASQYDTMAKRYRYGTATANERSQKKSSRFVYNHHGPSKIKDSKSTQEHTRNVDYNNHKIVHGN